MTQLCGCFRHDVVFLQEPSGLPSFGPYRKVLELLHCGGFPGKHLADAANLRAHTFQLFFDVLVSAVDVVDTVDNRLAVGN